LQYITTVVGILKQYSLDLQIKHQIDKKLGYYTIPICLLIRFKTLCARRRKEVFVLTFRFTKISVFYSSSDPKSSDQTIILNDMALILQVSNNLFWFSSKTFAKQPISGTRSKTGPPPSSRTEHGFPSAPSLRFPTLQTRRASPRGTSQTRHPASGALAACLCVFECYKNRRSQWRTLCCIVTDRTALASGIVKKSVACPRPSAVIFNCRVKPSPLHPDGFESKRRPTIWWNGRQKSRAGCRPTPLGTRAAGTRVYTRDIYALL